jgi:predicted restriction endonuclease
VTPLNKEQLARLLGMLGSNAIGERANAASLADRMVREAGLSWFEILEQDRANTKPGPTGTPYTDFLKAENQRLKTEVEELELRLKYGYQHRDLLKGDIDRLESELETAHGMGSALTEQLKQEREKIERERAIWAKEREAAVQRAEKLEENDRERKRFKRPEEKERRAYAQLALLTLGMTGAAVVLSFIITWNNPGGGSQPHQTAQPQQTDKVNEIVDGILRYKH